MHDLRRKWRTGIPLIKGITALLIILERFTTVHGNMYPVLGLSQLTAFVI
jgi:hypothetical protein